MFIVQIAGIDASGHTYETDAAAQKQRFIDSGTIPGTITIVEKATLDLPRI